MRTNIKAEQGDTVKLGEWTNSHVGHYAIVERIEHHVMQDHRSLRTYITKCQCGKTLRLNSTRITRVSTPCAYTFEGVVIPHSGWNSSSLESIPEGNFLDICDLLEKAISSEVPKESVYTAFGNPDDFWMPTVTKYRQETNDLWPPLYHVRITAQVRQLTQEQCEVYWKKVSSDKGMV